LIAFTAFEPDNDPILAVIPIGVKNFNVIEEVVADARNHFGDAVTSGIPLRTAFLEASHKNKPILSYDAKNDGATAFKEVASVIAQRLNLAKSSEATAAGGAQS
jgi:cellulose biosynthesis protein BcsQ